MGTKKYKEKEIKDDKTEINKIRIESMVGRKWDISLEAEGQR